MIDLKSTRHSTGFKMFGPVTRAPPPVHITPIMLPNCLLLFVQSCLVQSLYLHLQALLI